MRKYKASLSSYLKIGITLILLWMEAAREVVSNARCMLRLGREQFRRRESRDIGSSNLSWKVNPPIACNAPPERGGHPLF